MCSKVPAQLSVTTTALFLRVGGAWGWGQVWFSNAICFTVKPRPWLFAKIVYSKLSKATYNEALEHLKARWSPDYLCTCHGYMLGLTWTIIVSIVGNTPYKFEAIHRLCSWHTEKWVQLNHLYLFYGKGRWIFCVCSDDIHNVSDIPYKFEANFLRKREIFLIKVNSFEDSTGQKHTSIAIATLILQCSLCLLTIATLSSVHIKECAS